MRRTTSSCCASFCPKYARSAPASPSRMATTVVTPSKWPGRAAPSSSSVSSPTRTTVWNPAGYTSSTAGIQTMSAPAAPARATSAASSRGYFSKSDESLNWRGFTKTLTSTVALSPSAALIRDAWPWWSAPIVGTRPIGRGDSARTARSSPRVRTTRGSAAPATATGPGRAGCPGWPRPFRGDGQARAEGLPPGWPDRCRSSLPGPGKCRPRRPPRMPRPRL